VNKFVLVDTTYLLPIFGIPLKLDGIERRLETLFDNYNIVINSLSLLEAKWKVLKIARKLKIADDFFREGLIALIHRENVRIINFYLPELDELAMRLYSIHKDYFDCSIMAAALYFADVFLTEDSTLIELQEKVIYPNVLLKKRTTNGLSEKLEVKRISDFIE